MEERKTFLRRVLIACTAALALAVILLAFWYGVRIFLLAFAGVLFAVFLDGLRDFVLRHVSIFSPGAALFVVVLVLLAAATLLSWLLAPGIAAQVQELTESLPDMVDRLRDKVSQSGLHDLLGSRGDLLEGNAQRLRQWVMEYFSRGLEALLSALVILFVGLYLAASPQTYRQGFLRLLPGNRHHAAGKLLDRLGTTLRWWLLGRISAMTVVGVLWWIALAVLGIPVALALGLFAGLLAFIPNIGPFIAAIPPVLLGLSESVSLGVSVVIAYLAIQGVESYILTPMIQERTVSVPPALLLLAQIFMGIAFGTLGLLLATPSTAIAIVLVKDLYIHGALKSNEPE